MSLVIDENAIQQVLAHNSGAVPAYTVTALNIETVELSSSSALPLYAISGTIAPSPSGAEHEDLGFGTHIREAVEIVKDWIK
jgi:hypothetical protein